MEATEVGRQVVLLERHGVEGDRVSQVYLGGGRWWWERSAHLPALDLVHHVHKVQDLVGSGLHQCEREQKQEM